MTQPLSWTIHGNDRLSEVLERLDRNFDKLGRKMDQVGGDARQMGRTVGQAEGPVNRLASAAEHTGGRLHSLGERISGVASRVAQMSAAIVAAAAVATAALGTVAIKTASANEQAAISFELLLGSADKAASFLAEIQKFAAATPFEMPQLRTAASRLLAVGVATKDVIPLMEALGDATSGMGTGAEGIERAVTALTQMQMKTKVSAEEMLQLTEAGIPAWQALAAVLKVDVQTAMKMVEKRQVDAGKVFEAIEGKAGPAMQRLSGMMAKQATTLEGVWSTFKDNTSQALAQFAQPALGALKGLIVGTAAAVPQVLGKLRSMGRQVGDIFKGSDVPQRIKDSLKSFAEAALPRLEAAWNRILKTIEDNKEGLEKFGRFIADVVIPVVGGSLIGAIEILGAALQGVIWIVAHVVDAFKFMAGAFVSAAKEMLDAAEAAFGWVPGLKDDLHEAQAKFDVFAQHVKDKLDALDGITVTVAIKGVLSGALAGASPSFSSSILAGGTGGGHRAAGGPVWPGQVYTWREQGQEGLMLSGTSGTVISNQGMRSMGSGGGGDQIIGTVKLVLTTEEGQVLQEKLLKFKRQRGLTTLKLG